MERPTDQTTKREREGERGREERDERDRNRNKSGVPEKFAVQTKAKRINLFPRKSPGDIYIYTFDGTEL